MSAELFVVLLPYLFEVFLAYDDICYFMVLINCGFFVLFFTCVPRNTFTFNEPLFVSTDFCII
jgi:hypothetical protein